MKTGYVTVEEKEQEVQESGMKNYIYYKLVDVRCPVVGDRTVSEYGRA